MAEGHVAASRGLIKRGPLEKGMANHFSILSGEPHEYNENAKGEGRDDNG